MKVNLILWDVVSSDNTYDLCRMMNSDRTFEARSIYGILTNRVWSNSIATHNIVKRWSHWLLNGLLTYLILWKARPGKACYKHLVVFFFKYIGIVHIHIYSFHKGETIARVNCFVFFTFLLYCNNDSFWSHRPGPRVENQCTKKENVS